MSERSTAHVRLASVVAVAASAGLIGAHLWAERRGPSLTGPFLVLDHLFDLAVSVALLTVCAGVGGIALRRFGLRSLRPVEELLFAVPLGVGVLATIVLGAGAVGLLRPVVLFVLLAGAALVAWREIVAQPQRLARELRKIWTKREHTGLALLVATVLAAAAAFMLVFALAPPVDWDAWVYHLRVPTQFLERGGIYLPEDNLRVSFVALIHMLYLPLLAAGSEAGPAVVSVLFALLLGLAVDAFGARFLSGVTGGLAAALLWASGVILVTAMTPRIDVTLALFLLLAHYALLIAWREREHRWLWLAAILLGLGVGVKFNALPYILALGPVIVWAALRCAAGLPQAARTLGVVGALIAACSAPWLIKNWVLLGAPLYPLFAEELVTPWVGSLLGTSTVPPGTPPEVTRLIAHSREPFNLHDLFFDPGRISIEGEAMFHQFNHAFLFLPLSLLLIRRSTIALLLLPAVGYLLLILVPFPYTNLRYLIPAVAPLTIVVVYTGVRAAQRALSAERSGHVLVVLALIFLLPSFAMCAPWLRGTLAVQHLVGVRSARDYMHQHFLPHVRYYAPVVEAANDSVPPDGVVLMLFEDRGYGIQRRAIQDYAARAWPLIAANVPTEECLAGTEVTHVLFGVGATRSFLANVADSSVLRLHELRRFIDECLEPVYDTGPYELYRVAPPGAEGQGGPGGTARLREEHPVDRRTIVLGPRSMLVGRASCQLVEHKQGPNAGGSGDRLLSPPPAGRIL